MKAQIKRMWIKALRSGKYKQGKGMLHPGDKFCCLGVLTDLFIAKTGKGKWLDEGVVQIDKMREGSELPTQVCEWAGLIKDGEPDADPLLGVNKTAAKLNDGGKSFNFIAGRIEKYL